MATLIAKLLARIKVGGTTVDEDVVHAMTYGASDVLTNVEMSFLCVVVKSLSADDEVTATIGWPLGGGTTSGTVSGAALTAIKISDIAP